MSIDGEPLPPPMPAITRPSESNETPKSSLVPLTFASTMPAPWLHFRVVLRPCVDLNQNSMEKSLEIWRVAVPYDVVPLNDTAVFGSPGERPATPRVVPDSVALAGRVGSEPPAVVVPTVSPNRQ